MYTGTMQSYAKFKLTRAEQKLLTALSGERPASAYSLEKRARLPHSTTLYALKSLASRELAVIHRYKKRILWTKETGEAVQNVKNDPILIHQGKRALQTLVDDIFTLTPYERLYTLQGENTFETWTEVLGERYIAKLNRKIKAQRIIVETLIPSDLFYSKKFPASFLKSYRGRMTDARIVPKEMFSFSSDLAMWRDRICLMNWQKKIAIEIKDVELGHVISSLFFFTQANARKTDINRELKET